MSRVIVLLWFCSLPVCGQTSYYPDRNHWETRSPQQVGLNEGKIKEAVNYAQAHEYTGPKDLRIAIAQGFEHEPYHQILGPTKKRGSAAGMIIKDGYLVASWGDIKRVDMTFSVTKSYLATVAGLAWDAGLIANVNQPLTDYIWDGTFDGAHNSQITWEHLLNQSSDWYGQLWGGYDWADRPPREGSIDDWRNRHLNTPGTHFKYNDVRVNLLAYSLLQVWRKPLPMILKEKIMDPIGASSTWRWHGYDNSWVEIDGVKMQSVSGGGHSGGGLFINTEDHARFGLLFLNEGKWKDQQLISKARQDLATTPSKANNQYGFLWWLDPDDKSGLSTISQQAFYAAGFGGNYIVVEPEKNLVVVMRWMDRPAVNEFLKMVYEAF